MLFILVGFRFLIKINHIVSHCCGIGYIYGTRVTRFKQFRHVVTDGIKDNLKNLPKLSLVMALCENGMVFQLLKKPNTGHYVKCLTAW